MQRRQVEADYTVHDGIISSDPDLMTELVDPRKLAHGETLWITDALNVIGETMWLGDEEGGQRGAEDGQTYYCQRSE